MEEARGVRQITKLSLSTLNNWLDQNYVSDCKYLQKNVFIRYNSLKNIFLLCGEQSLLTQNLLMSTNSSLNLESVLINNNWNSYVDY